jgi:hypothetical protein
MPRLTPYKLCEHIAYLFGGDMSAAEEAVYHAVISGRLPALLPSRRPLNLLHLRLIRAKRWDPKGSVFALPGDIGIDVEDATHLFAGAQPANPPY